MNRRTIKKLLIFLGMASTFSCEYVSCEPADTTKVVSSTSDTVSPPDTAWKFGTIMTLTLAQSAFNNWSAGGENSSAINGRGNLNLKYQKGKILWLNTLDMAYGYSNAVSTGFRKNDDVFEFNSTGGYKASKRWYYSTLLNVKSQFTKGVDYKDTTTISNFLAPLYFNFAFGMNYTPNDNLSVFLTPVSAKLTYVSDTALGSRYSVDPGKKLKTELGLLAKAVYQQNVTKNTVLLSRFEVFYNYLHYKNEALNRIKIPYVSWEVLLSVKVFKSIAINLNAKLIYDDNYRKQKPDGSFDRPKLQFKEVLGIGLSYDLNK